MIYTQFNSIAVFCGSSSGNNPLIAEEAYNLGKILALRKIDLIYGGSKLGLMGQVAKGVLDHQGKAIGVIPGFLKTKEVAHEHLTDLIVTNNMHERKLKMHELSDGIITLPGGFGTMEEFFEILTWAQLGLHQKPIGLLNVEDFFNDLLRLFKNMTAKGFLKETNLNLLCVSKKCESLLKEMEDYKPKPVPKWLHKNET